MRQNVVIPLVIGSILLIGALLWWRQVSFKGHTSPDALAISIRTPVRLHEGVTSQTNALPPSSAGDLRAYLDPATGQLTNPPQSVQPVRSVGRDKASSSSSEGLVQVPSPVPGGGIMVDLQGRYRVQTIATIEAQSNVSIRSTPFGIHTNEGSPLQK